MLLLLSLVFLVVYLDGGLDGEPSIFFVILGFFDILFLSAAVVRIMRHYQICGIGRRQYDMNAPYPVTTYIYPLEKQASAVVFGNFTIAQKRRFADFTNITGLQNYFRSIALYSIKIWYDPSVLAGSAILVIFDHLDHRTNFSLIQYTQ
ncbi:unnamed protein product [Wuchereria bancrofti]|uniref:Uncharacterized protein n=1 Tax=Wuchereria bancrofti TaxID=6293 RepID=A0A3P7FZK6_WUCBA|nr:unnamed protein product [Wuchereria bancrofti]